MHTPHDSVILAFMRRHATPTIIKNAGQSQTESWVARSTWHLQSCGPNRATLPTIRDLVLVVHRKLKRTRVLCTLCLSMVMTAITESPATHCKHHLVVGRLCRVTCP